MRINDSDSREGDGHGHSPLLSSGLVPTYTVTLSFFSGPTDDGDDACSRDVWCSFE